MHAISLSLSVTVRNTDGIKLTQINCFYINLTSTEFTNPKQKRRARISICIPPAYFFTFLVFLGGTINMVQFAMSEGSDSRLIF